MPRGRKRKEEITSSVKGDDTAEAEVKKSSEESQAKKRKGSDNNMTFKIEHCKSWQVYKRNANQLSSELMKAFPDAVVLINDTKPRSKSFEVTVIKEDGEESLVWTGIKKGPPRKLKFPVNEEVIQEVKKLI